MSFDAAIGLFFGFCYGCFFMRLFGPTEPHATEETGS